MSYATLGSRYQESENDATGLNTGNFTTAFTAADLGVKVPEFEVARGIVQDILPGATAVVTIGVRGVSYTRIGAAGAEWDPVQPPILRPGQDLYFLWSTPYSAGTKPPRVTVWLRYDTEIIEAARKGLLQ